MKIENILLGETEIPPPQHEFIEFDNIVKDMVYFASKIKPDGIFLKEYMKAFEKYKNATNKLISVLEHENMYLSVALSDLYREYSLIRWQFNDYIAKMQNIIKFQQEKIKTLQNGN